MRGQFPQPSYSPANHNIFQIINFKTYEWLPRWNKQDPDPIFMTNIYRRMADIAWHSRYQTTFPHSLPFQALRAIVKDDMQQLMNVLRNPYFDINGRIDKKYNLNAIQYAAMKNKFHVIELLLLHGANINKTDEEGNSPLMMAVMNHSLQSINTLLKNGCDRDRANIYGTTPIRKAKQDQHQYVADFIQNYPKVGRRFPKFVVKTDIEKKLNSKLSYFLNDYKIFNKKPIKSPFNNFKGQYKIVLNNCKSMKQYLDENQNIEK